MFNHALFEQYLQRQITYPAPFADAATGKTWIDPFNLVGFAAAIDEATKDPSDSISSEQRFEIFKQTYQLLRTELFRQSRIDEGKESQEVLASVEAHGIQRPILIAQVAPPDPSYPNACWDIVDGTTRLLGFVKQRLLNTTEALLLQGIYIPVEVGTGTPEQLLGMAGAANMLRANFTDADVINHVKKMTSQGMTQEAIRATLLLNHRAHNDRVKRIFELTQQSPVLAEQVAEGNISLNAASKIQEVSNDPETQAQLADRIAAETLAQANQVAKENKEAAEATPRTETRGRKPAGGKQRDVLAEGERRAIDSVLSTAGATVKVSQTVASYKEVLQSLLGVYGAILDELHHVGEPNSPSIRPLDVTLFTQTPVHQINEIIIHWLSFQRMETELVTLARVLKTAPSYDIPYVDKFLTVFGLKAESDPVPPADDLNVILASTLMAVRMLVTPEMRKSARVTVHGEQRALRQLEQSFWSLVAPMSPYELGSSPAVAVNAPAPIPAVETPLATPVLQPQPQPAAPVPAAEEEEVSAAPAPEPEKKKRTSRKKADALPSDAPAAAVPGINAGFLTDEERALLGGSSPETSQLAGLPAGADE